MPKSKYKRSYADTLILGGLRTYKEAKAGAKKQFKKDIGKIKSILKRKKKPKKPVSTTRTEGTYSGMGSAGVDYEKEKPSSRLRRKKK